MNTGSTFSVVAVPRLFLVAGVAAVALLAGCGGGGTGGSLADPAHSVAAKPDYTQTCAMSGIDQSPGCLQVALQAIDSARAKEQLGPLHLPAGFATLPFDQQMLAVVDAERVDRHLAPVTGISADLDELADRGARVNDLPPAPSSAFGNVHSDADAGFSNALDVDYQWVYDDGPGSDTNGCNDPGDPGCWADRHVVLSDPTDANLVLGAAEDPTGDTQSDDRGGPSMSLVIASAGPAQAVTTSWSDLKALTTRGTLAPLAHAPLGVSETGIRDPAHTEPPVPDYTQTCATSGLDDSPGCLAAILAAVNNARAKEGVRPMVLPPGFASMSVPEQLLVTTNLERVDRGLPPFAGLTQGLDANALVGARQADDPPDPDNAIGDDEEWSGGAVNGLDADYGWMYDDGRGSANADCPRSGGAGCWGHREGILDNFGTVGTMAMGAAFTTTRNLPEEGFAGGTSMAMTLVAQSAPPASYVLTWARAQAGGT